MKPLCHPSYRIRTGGFTLVELMITLVIAAILLGIGVPSFRSLIQNQRMTATVNDMFAAINLTRDTAVARAGRKNVLVVLAPSDGIDWNKGWVIFIDDKAQDMELSNGEEVIFRSDAVPDGISIATKFTDNDKQYIAFKATGNTRTKDSPQQPQLGTISFSQGGQVKRRIKINFLGRARVCDAADATNCGAGAEDN